MTGACVRGYEACQFLSPWPCFPIGSAFDYFQLSHIQLFCDFIYKQICIFFQQSEKKKSPSWPVSVTPPNPHPLFNKVSDFLKSLSLKLEVLIIVMQNKWKSWNCLPFVVWIQVRSTGTRLEGFNHSSLECSGRG